jgi:hypothetical protein
LVGVWFGYPKPGVRDRFERSKGDNDMKVSRIVAYRGLAGISASCLSRALIGGTAIGIFGAISFVWVGVDGVLMGYSASPTGDHGEVG